jgi:hypothetical protein
MLNSIISMWDIDIGIIICMFFDYKIENLTPFIFIFMLLYYN